MKLPENRADRIKILVLIVMGAVAVIYGVVFGAIKPLLEKKAKLQADIEKFKDNLNKASGIISRIEKTQNENIDLAKEIIADSSRCILRSRHGNYLIGAKKIIEQAAAQSGVNIISVNEIGISVLEMREQNQAKQKSEKAFKAYTAEASAKSGLKELTEMIETLEKSNPFLCLTKIQITADERDPLKHKVTIRVQWPIWADSDTEENIRAQFAEPYEKMNTSASVTPSRSTGGS